MVDYSHFFNPFSKRVREAEKDEFVVESEILEFAGIAFYTRFMAWLDKEASRPLKIGNHMDMIQSAVRANTLREIRDTIVRRVDQARAAMSAGEE